MVKTDDNFSKDIDAIFDKILKDSRKTDKKRYLFDFFLVVPITFSIITATLLLFYPDNKKYVEKVPIKEMISKTIKNGGEYNSIKHIYNTRNLKSVPFFKLTSNSNNNYYADDYPLSGILNDLLVDYFQSSKNKDSVYYRTLCCIIAENEKQDPFDNLEDNQKYNFESIQEKLDSTYTKITPEIIKIVEELKNKNQLVSKYLNKSNISFRISIIALIITILLSLYQIYQNYSTNKAIREIIIESTSKEDDSKAKQE